MAFVLDLELHPNQQIVYDDNHRVKVVVAGRQFGKSGMAARAAVGLSLTKPNSVQMIVAPYTPQAYEDYIKIKEFLPRQYTEGRFKVKESAKWLTLQFHNGSRILLKGAENLVGLRGYTLDNLIMDEAGAMNREVWKILEPELAVRHGTAWVLGNPVFGGWFKELSEMEKTQPDRYKTFHFISTDSPFYSQEESDAYRESHTVEEYEQEILAKFLEGGLVFPRLKEIMTAQPREPVKDHHYVTGADLANLQDFMVLKTFDLADNHEVDHQRFNKRGWDAIRQTIYATCKRYNNSTLIIDQTGVGAPIVEDLQKMKAVYPGAPEQGYLIVVPQVFSGVTKPQLYTNYIMAHENGVIRLLEEQVTKKEHEDFIVTKTPSGNSQYHAPKGSHDDCVTAAALAVWGIDKYGGNLLVGPYTQDQFDKEKKKQIDPSCMLDVDAIILKNESRQISGFSTEEDQNINPNYE
jgi:hypothetical protein